MFEQPNYTQIPNQLLDEHMSTLSGAELKLCLAIARQTFGWHKEGDKLSIKQLCALTGLSNRAICTAIESVLAKGIISREAEGQGFVYSLSISTCEESSHVPVKKVHMQPVKKVHTQNKYIKKEKERDLPAAQDTPTTTTTVPEKAAGVTGDAIPSPDMPPPPLPTEQQRKFAKLCEIVGWDYKTITEAQKKQVAQTLGILTKAGYIEEHLNQFFEKVWSKDWRWMNHRSYPNLSQVRAEIGKLRAAPDMKPVITAPVTSVPEQQKLAPYMKLQQQKGFYTQ